MLVPMAMFNMFSFDKLSNQSINSSLFCNRPVDKTQLIRIKKEKYIFSKIPKKD